MVQKIFGVLKNRLKEACSHQDSNGPPVDEIGEAHFVTFTNPLEKTIENSMDFTALIDTHCICKQNWSRVRLFAKNT